MPSVLCLFHTIPVGDQKIDILEAIYSREHDKKADKEAKKRAKETQHHYHVEMWNVK